MVCARRIAEDPPILDIAHAMIYSLRGDLSSAIDILQNRTLAEFPNHDLAKSVLGMTLKMAKKESWRGLFGEVLASSTDSEARMISSEGLKEE